jgi:hypothetical protein
MLIKLGTIMTIAEAKSFNGRVKEFPWFVKNNKSAMERLAAIEPIVLDPSRFLYMRTRMVSAVEMHGPNANGDAFEHQELAMRYPTFIRAAVNIDHKNDDPKLAVGFILDARYVNEQMFVEGIHAIDKKKADKRFPGIVRKIEAGIITDTSMGCFVERSICSECLREAGWDGNWDPQQPGSINRYVAMLKLGRGIATVPEEYCRHIGKYGEKKGGEGGPYEINRGVTFFEDSIITTAGADKDAKYTEKLASLDSADWEKYLTRYAMKDNALVVQSNSQGGDAIMKPKLEKKADAEMKGSELITGKDAGDFGSAEEKDKDLAEQAKGKSDGADDDKKGSQLMTSEGKGDLPHTGAKKVLEALTIVKKLAKEDPEAVRTFLAADEEKDEKKEEKKPEMKKEEAVAQPKKGLFARAMDLVKGAADLAKEAAGEEMNGSQLMTVQEPGDKGSAEEKDNDLANQAKKTAPVENDKKGSQLMTSQDPDNHPHTAAKKTAENKDEKKDEKKEEKKDEKKEAAEVPSEGEAYEKEEKEEEKKEAVALLQKLEAGKTFAEAEKDDDDKKNEEKREARRKKLAEDLNRGSMGSSGVDNKVAEAPQEGENSNQKLDATSPNQKEMESKTPIKEGDDKAKKNLQEFHKKVEGPVSEKMEDMEEKAVASKTAEDASLDKGNIETKDTEQIRKDDGRKVGSKKEAEGDQSKAVAPGTHKDKEKSPEETLKEKTSAEEVTPEKAEDMVKKMDGKEAAIKNILAGKKLRAETLARAGYKSAALEHVTDIQKLTKHVANFRAIAEMMEGLMDGFGALNQAKQASVKLTLSSLIRKADDEMKETDKDVEKMKDGDMKKEEAYHAAKKHVELEASLKTEKQEKVEAKRVIASMVKSKAVAELVRIGRAKGLVTEANMDERLKSLAAMSEDQFNATKLAWSELPDKTSEKKEYVAPHIREAQEKGEGMGTLTPRKTASVDEEQSLEAGNFFD